MNARTTNSAGISCTLGTISIDILVAIAGLDVSFFRGLAAAVAVSGLHRQTKEYIKVMQRITKKNQNWTFREGVVENHIASTKRQFAGAYLKAYAPL